jgi:STE24 endopeptidase
MGSALLRLNDHNLSNLAPHPWFSRYHYSHPTLLERLGALGLAQAPGRGAGAAARC